MSDSDEVITAVIVPPARTRTGEHPRHVPATVEVLGEVQLRIGQAPSVPIVDHGLRRLVPLLRHHHFDVLDHSDGYSRPAAQRRYDCAYVCIGAPRDRILVEADRLFALMLSLGVIVRRLDDDETAPGIAATYYPSDRGAAVLLRGVLDGDLQQEAP